MSVETLLVDAISSRRVVEFRYRQLPRVVEPHTLGINLDGVEQLLGYQIGGSSSSGRLPDWRRFDIAKINGLRTRQESFPHRPSPSGRHASWSSIIAFVPEAR